VRFGVMIAAGFLLLNIVIALCAYTYDPLTGAKPSIEATADTLRYGTVVVVRHRRALIRRLFPVFPFTSPPTGPSNQ